MELIPSVFHHFIAFALGGINEFLGSDVPGSSLGVEIDTWQNGNFADPVQDHVCIFRDGVNNHNIPFFNLDGPVSARSDGANIEDGQPHQFKVEWDPVTQELQVYFDCELRLSWTGDLSGEIFGGETQLWWGFTGSTGGSSNAQEVCFFSLSLGNSWATCAATGTRPSWSPALLASPARGPADYQRISAR